MATFNWSDLRKQAEAAGESTEGFTPLDPGVYDVVVSKVTVKEFKNKTKEGWNLQFSVDGGPESGRRVFTNLVISPESPKAIAIMLRQLEALGVRAVLDAGGTLQQVAAALLNQKATIEVSQRVYNNNLTNDVDKITARAGGDPVLGGTVTATASVTPAGLPI